MFTLLRKLRVRDGVACGEHRETGCDRRAAVREERFGVGGADAFG